MNLRCPKRNVLLYGVAIGLGIIWGAGKYTDERQNDISKIAIPIRANKERAKALWREISYLRNQNNGMGRLELENNRKLLRLVDDYSKALTGLKKAIQSALQLNQLPPIIRVEFEKRLIPACDIGLEEANIIREEARTILEPFGVSATPIGVTHRWGALEERLEMLDQKAALLAQKEPTPADTNGY